MKIYGIYDITNKEQCVRIGTLKDIMKFGLKWLNF